MVLGENRSHEKGKGAGDKVMMREPGMAEYVTNSGGTEARGLRELGHLQFFEASLGYMRSCVKTISKKRKEKWKELSWFCFVCFPIAVIKSPTKATSRRKTLFGLQVQVTVGQNSEQLSHAIHSQEPRA